MSELYKFAGERPFLTVILASIVMGGLVQIFRGYDPKD